MLIVSIEHFDLTIKGNRVDGILMRLDEKFPVSPIQITREHDFPAKEFHHQADRNARENELNSISKIPHDPRVHRKLKKFPCCLPKNQQTIYSFLWFFISSLLAFFLFMQFFSLLLAFVQQRRDFLVICSHRTIELKKVFPISKFLHTQNKSAFETLKLLTTVCSKPWHKAQREQENV